ncbi:MAG: TRAP transporter substrate-binding protein [Eubacteriales bacterium]|nr:TRAP transporter substrate-binding protein [Eubacteriales bacterium]
MKKRLITVALLLIMCISISACGGEQKPATSTDKQEDTKQVAEVNDNKDTKDKADANVIELKASHSVAPTHPYQLGLEKFAELVSEKTNGKYKIDIFHSAQLGNERDNYEGLQLGTVDITMGSTGPMGTFVKDFQMLDLPFLFESYEKADAVLDGELGQKLFEKLDAIGIVGGAFCDNGFRQITTSEKWGPIEKVEDLKGLKVRTMENEVHMETFKTLGADPTPMAYSEVFTSLQTGVLDSQENPIPIIYNNRIYEVQKNLSLTNHFYSPAMILFSGKMFEKLDADTQAIFLESAKEAAAYEREQIRKQEKEQLEELKALNMNIAEPDLAPFKEACQPIYEKYKETWDAELMKILFDATK